MGGGRPSTLGAAREGGGAPGHPGRRAPKIKRGWGKEGEGRHGWELDGHGRSLHSQGTEGRNGGGGMEDAVGWCHGGPAPALAAAAVNSEEEGREYGWWRLGKNGGWECKIAQVQGKGTPIYRRWLGLGFP
jgi:hypothetical protein